MAEGRGSSRLSGRTLSRSPDGYGRSRSGSRDQGHRSLEKRRRSSSRDGKRKAVRHMGTGEEIIWRPAVQASLAAKADVPATRDLVLLGGRRGRHEQEEEGEEEDDEDFAPS